jgi:hypothetical protein
MQFSNELVFDFVGMFVREYCPEGFYPPVSPPPPSPPPPVSPPPPLPVPPTPTLSGNKIDEAIDSILELTAGVSTYAIAGITATIIATIMAYSIRDWPFLLLHLIPITSYDHLSYFMYN